VGGRVVRVVKRTQFLSQLFVQHFHTRRHLLHQLKARTCSRERSVNEFRLKQCNRSVGSPIPDRSNFSACFWCFC
jgi:hypothetical protein